jgi:2-polyprenyl-3-methyl-5-hydroxy-6-metoxy-1,4-benzoquinol methylase
MSSNEKTEVGHWESAWTTRPRLRFPSGINISIRNLMRLMSIYIRPNLRCLEIGCAPGKFISWVGREIGAPVCGIDYSPTGVDTTRWLCDGLGIKADIRCEDANFTTFSKSSFDLVFSFGLIEHFEDPRQMVLAHVELLAPGGVAIISVPNYSGIYLKLQSFFNPKNLDIHNLTIMNEKSILELVPKSSNLIARSFTYGRFSPWLISFSTKFGVFGKIFSWVLNFVGLLQPIDVRYFSPLIVLEIRKHSD